MIIASAPSANSAVKKYPTRSNQIGELMKSSMTKLALLIYLILILAVPAHAVRIKDIVDIKGVRQNQLVGYGLVVGLNGTGDSDDATFMIQSFVSMLERMGVTVQPEDIEIDNVAAVMVTADLPAFAHAGSRIDVLVSSIGDAQNLQGGTLLFTPLKGADGHVYAVAQGPVSTGGFSAGSESGSGVQKNHPTAGRVVNGAIIEKEIVSNFNNRHTLTLNLHRADFTTASRVARAIIRFTPRFFNVTPVSILDSKSSPIQTMAMSTSWSP